MCRRADYTTGSKRRKGEFAMVVVEKSQKRTIVRTLTDHVWAIAVADRVARVGQAGCRGSQPSARRGRNRETAAMELTPAGKTPRTRLPAKLPGHENIPSSKPFPGSVPGDSGHRPGCDSPLPRDATGLDAGELSGEGILLERLAHGSRHQRDQAQPDSFQTCSRFEKRHGGGHLSGRRIYGALHQQ